VNKRIPIISVGGGWVVNNRHLLALRQSGLFDVLGAVSDDRERAMSTARRFGLAHYATALDFNLPWQAEAKAVMIGSIPHAHFELARASLLAGKHVLTEKPMIIEPADAKELIRLAAEKNLVLAVVHNFQFSRAAQRFRNDMAAGRLGAVKAVYGVQLCNHQRNIPAWCDQLPLGLFFDEAPHFYYTFRWLAEGDLDLLDGSVWKSDEQRNTPRAVSAEYKSHRGIPFRLHINFDSSITEWHVTVVCEKATVDIDIWRDIYVSLPNDGEHKAKDILWTSLAGAAQHFTGVVSGALRYFLKRHLYGNDQVVRRFHHAIQGEDSLKGMSAADGLCVVEMMHELIQKARYC
jgi:scyllo-inositol 2-dehydrogenase (NADP+)